MRKLFIIFSLLMLVAAVSFGQVWKYVDDGPFPDTSLFKINFAINNGITVDQSGWVWLQVYSASFDSIETAPGVYLKTGSIYVFNPNGSGAQAAFSPIKTLQGVDELGNAVSDTLYGSGYGMSIDPSTGDILSVKGSTRVWRIDAKTGQGIRRILNPIPGYASSLAGICANGLGEIYLAPVIGPAPVQILNPDFSAGTQVVPDLPAYSRDIAVSADGNDVYCPIFTSQLTYVYHSDFGSLGPYALADSIFVGMSTESIKPHPVTGYIWADADSRSTTGTPCSYYAYDPGTKAIVDSFYVWPPSLQHPRGIAFSPTGDTVYVSHFGSGFPYVQRFVRKFVMSVDRIDNALPGTYTLDQNYPNPFNPSTKITFTIGKTGFASLKVYDVLGREVQTLVSEDLVAGVYTTTFDASKLSTGTYVYVLTAGDVRISQKMVFAK